MRAYFIRRLLLIPPTLIGVTFIVFMLTRFVPGGPMERYIAQMKQASLEGGANTSMAQDEPLSQEQLLGMKRLYLLDHNAFAAYSMWLGIWPREYWQKDVKFKKTETEKAVRTKGARDRVKVIRKSDSEFEVLNPDGTPNEEWEIRVVREEEIPQSEIPEGEARAVIFKSKINGLSTGYLGHSFRYQDSVWSLILDRLPVSAYFGFMTVLITYIVSIPLGVAKAVWHRSWFDNLSSISIFVGFAIPSYALASLFMVFLGARWGWFPTSGITSYNFKDLTFGEQVTDILNHTFLPLVAYVIHNFAFLTLLMKNHLMDNLAADYVRTAVAKGVSFWGAVRKHAFRNSLVPIATNFGHQISLFVGGSFLIEKIFDINGVALLGFESLLDRDYPVVMGILVISSTVMMIGNILSDILVAIVDPKVRFE